MHDVRTGEQDLLRLLSPDSFLGAGIYLVIFVLLALLLARLLGVRCFPRLGASMSVAWTGVATRR